MRSLNLRALALAFVILFGTRLLAQTPTPSTAQTQPKTATTAPAVTPGSEELRKGIELLAAKNYAAAETSLRAAVAAQPANPTAHYNLAVALLNNNKLEESEKEFTAAAPLANGTPAEQAGFYGNRGAMYARREKWIQAEADLLKAIQLNPNEPYNHYYLGVTEYRLKRPDRMVTELTMFLKLAPNAPEAPKCRAMLKSLGR